MAKNVGLLTLHLHTNYGGILQIVALYQFLAANGKRPILLRKKPARPLLPRLMASILRRIPGQDLGRARSSERERALHYPFIKRFMPHATPELRTSDDFTKATSRYKLDAVVVGSDQVWRFEYHADSTPMTFFLDFIKSSQIRRISYAASFGLSEWANPAWTSQTSALLSKFHAVSVRENSGAAICSTALGRPDCIVTLDPTLLIDPGFYYDAMSPDPVYYGQKIVSYVLDKSVHMQNTAGEVSRALGGSLETFSLLSSNAGKRLNIPQWLRSIRDAEFVITDSFHGMVFCIIFKKNFIAIPNIGRGIDRFTTLLDNLGLMHRLLTPDNADIYKIVKTPINYSDPYIRLDKFRKTSREFLLNALE